MYIYSIHNLVCSHFTLTMATFTLHKPYNFDILCQTLSYFPVQSENEAPCGSLEIASGCKESHDQCNKYTSLIINL